MKYVKLGDICSTTQGIQIPKSEQINQLKEEYARYLYIADFKEDNNKKYVKNCYDEKKVTENELVMANTGSPGAVFKGKSGILSNNLFKITFNSSVLDRDFLYYYLSSDKFQEILQSKMKGGIQKHLGHKTIGEQNIPLISLENQKKVVILLDQAQQLIDLRKEQIQACDELIKSQFIEMFGDIVSNTKEWAQDILDNHLQVFGGYAFKSDKFTESGIPVLKIGNINVGYFKDTNLMYWDRDEQLKRYEIYPGDLVISLTGTVGKDDYGNVCIIGDAFPMYYLNQRNAKLDLNNTLDKYYLTYALKVPGIKLKLTGISRGVRQANISNKDIQNLEMPIPPIGLQNQFAQFVQQVDKLKFEMEQSLVELENNFNALMQRAFKGELF